MTSEDRPEWLPASGEAIQYTGGPRIQAAIPAAIAGLTLVVVGVVLAVGLGPVPAALVPQAGGAIAVLAGLAIPALAIVWLRHTEYVVTDAGLYTKRGVLGRSVTSVAFETVQNVSTAQSVTGRLFDHGTVAVETAGGGGSAIETEGGGSVGPELAFKHVDDPRSIARLIGEGQSSVRGDPAASAGPAGRVPGSVERWLAIRDEVRAWRQAVDRE
ncbi:MAG: PH domain-containing protein [Halococcoides sp.]